MMLVWSKLRELMKEFKEEISLIDPVTLLPNRKGLDAHLQNEWNKLCRKNILISLILLEIDDFDAYKTSYGHSLTKRVFKSIGEALSQSLKRANDYLARFNEKTFAVLLSLSNSEEAIKSAEYLRKRIEYMMLEHKESTVSDYITVSIGVGTIAVDKDVNTDKLIEITRIALEKAQTNGMDRVVSQFFNK